MESNQSARQSGAFFTSATEEGHIMVSEAPGTGLEGKSGFIRVMREFARQRRHGRWAWRDIEK